MDDSCTIYRTADFIGKRWTLLILLELHKGSSKKKRYSVLKEHLHGITPKILSMRLKELEKEGLVTKKIDAKRFPVKCEYFLSESGEDFIDIIKNMKSWALKWKFENKICRESSCINCRI